MCKNEHILLRDDSNLLSKNTKSRVMRLHLMLWQGMPVWQIRDLFRLSACNKSNHMQKPPMRGGQNKKPNAICMNEATTFVNTRCWPKRTMGWVGWGTTMFVSTAICNCPLFPPNWFPCPHGIHTWCRFMYTDVGTQSKFPPSKQYQMPNKSGRRTSAVLKWLSKK